MACGDASAWRRRRCSASARSRSASTPRATTGARKRVSTRARFIFKGIGGDELTGDFGILGGGASGSEIDAADPMLGTPAHTIVVASSEDPSANIYLVPDETGFHHSAMDGVQNPKVRAYMTFFETSRVPGRSTRPRSRSPYRSGNAPIIASKEAPSCDQQQSGVVF